MMLKLALVILFALGACANETSSAPDEPTAVDPERLAPQATLEAFQTLQRATAGEGRARLADGFRFVGASMNAPVMRRDLLPKLSEEDAAKVPDDRETLLVLAHSGKILRIAAEDNNLAAKDPPTRYLEARVFELDSDGKVSRITAFWDNMTMWGQAGVEVGEFPARPPVWSDRGELVADGGELEATSHARAVSFARALGESDLGTASELVAPGFVDRDITATADTSYDQPDEFVAAFAAAREAIEASHLTILESWAVDRWGVVIVREGFRVKGGADAVSYELWLLRFSDGEIDARWRFRDRFAVEEELGLVDGRRIETGVRRAYGRLDSR